MLYAQSLRHVWLFAAPWSVACQPPLSMEFSRQEYWSGLPFPTPGGLPDPGIKAVSCSSCTGGQILYNCATWEAYTWSVLCVNYTSIELEGRKATINKWGRKLGFLSFDKYSLQIKPYEYQLIRIGTVQSYSIVFSTENWHFRI